MNHGIQSTESAASCVLASHRAVPHEALGYRVRHMLRVPNHVLDGGGGKGSSIVAAAGLLAECISYCVKTIACSYIFCLKVFNTATDCDSHTVTRATPQEMCPTFHCLHALAWDRETTNDRTATS